MSEAVSGTILTRRPSAESRSVDTRAMSSTTLAGKTATTRDEPTAELPTAIEGPYVPREIDGGVVIEAQAFEHTNDGDALRYAGSTPTHIVGVCSEMKVRNALAEYSDVEISRAIAWGKQLEAEHIANANAAVTAAKSRELVTDGGHDTRQATLAAGASEQSDDDDDELCDFCGYEPGTTTPQSPDGREGFVCLECGASLEGRER